jgi:hypothetical protein
MAWTLESRQKKICSKYEAEFFGCDLELKVGIARNVPDGARPLNGLRIKPERGTSGWYIWAGEEWSDDPDFFVPLHGKHLTEWAPMVLPYLGLPPGWRFLITEGYEDVWDDPGLEKDTNWNSD